MREASSTPALLIIDVQQGFDDPVWGPRNNPHAESEIARLLEAWRAARGPIFHIRHDSGELQSPLRPGQPGNQIKAEARPLAGEPVIGKSVNSAFIGTDLEARLRRHGVDAVVIAGITTNHCVSTSARMAGNLGFATYVVANATATFDRAALDGSIRSAEEVHAAALSDLNDEFAIILSSDEAISKLKDHQDSSQPNPADALEREGSRL